MPLRVTRRGERASLLHYLLHVVVVIVIPNAFQARGICFLLNVRRSRFLASLEMTTSIYVGNASPKGLINTTRQSGA